MGDPLGLMRQQCHALCLRLGGAWEFSQALSRVVQYNWPDTVWTALESFSALQAQEMRLAACHTSHLVVYVCFRNWADEESQQFLAALTLLRAEWGSAMLCCVRVCGEWNALWPSKLASFGVCAWRPDPWNSFQETWFGTSFGIGDWPFPMPPRPAEDSSPALWERVLGLPHRYSLVVERTRFRKSAPLALSRLRLSLLQAAPLSACLLWILGSALRDIQLLPELQWPFVSAVAALPSDQAQLVLVSALASRADLSGSDVRLTTGDVFKTNAWPRKALKVHLWQWRTCLSWAWKAGSFITELEARAALSALRYRIRTGGALDIKFVHGLDNQAALSVLAKGRSSSSVLHRIVQQHSALLLAVNLVGLFTYVDTDTNPVDVPTRS
eukprot:6457137-Amphidinium_carterae.1